jgi:transposase
MKRPEEVNLSYEEREALIERLERHALTTDDRRVLVQLIRFAFWRIFALQEARLSLKRLRALVFGEKPKQRKDKDVEASSGSRGRDRGQGHSSTESEPGVSQAASESPQRAADGHGRHSAEVYSGATQVICRHETLAAGARCPVCGRGCLYRLDPGVDLRIDGHALLSAVRYTLEKLRCSACGQVFTAASPAEVGGEKYSARARAVLVLGRYYLGVPLSRLEGYQTMGGVPVPDATQWDQIERVADCAYPVFEHLKGLAAQGEVIYQDDTHVRILSLMATNRQAQAAGTPEERTGMYTTALVAQQGAQTICLYFAGRAHAGEHLAALLTQREEDRGKPVVMSDALAANAADEAALIRCHCLAHGRRKCSELEEVFPAECTVVIDALKQVFDHEEEARGQQMSTAARFASHQHYSGPIMAALKGWLEQQCEDREVEPNSSLGKAFQYLLTHWEPLTRFLAVPGAPMDHNTAERALKLAIRQRKNSLFYATEHSASMASLLTSLIATCLQAGVNALEYLVALQENRTAVLRHPAAWLPWTSQANHVPPSASFRQSSAMLACCGLPFQNRMANSRADRRALASWALGHQVKRPWERRFVQSQHPCPSYNRILSVVPERLRKT